MIQVDSYFLRDFSDRDEAERYHAVPLGATTIPEKVKLWTDRDHRMALEIHKMQPKNERAR